MSITNLMCQKCFLGKLGPESPVTSAASKSNVQNLASVFMHRNEGCRMSSVDYEYVNYLWRSA